MDFDDVVSWIITLSIIFGFLLLAGSCIDAVISVGNISVDTDGNSPQVNNTTQTVASQPTQIPYDSYNFNYWQSRLKS
jgi:hypothetical protein